MAISPFKSGRTRWTAIYVLAAIVAPWALVQAGKTIQELRAADPQGEVEIVNVSGLVEVAGWERNELEISGTAGSGVDRVDVTGTGNRTSIHVVSKASHSWGMDSEAHLLIHVPARSAVSASLVSADFKVTGVLGNLKVQSVSGNVSGDAGADVVATTVSGDVRLTARAAKSMEVKTISGDIQVTGGGGEADFSTVSGEVSVDLAGVSRGRFKSVSGDVTAVLALMPDGQIDSQSISGDVGLNFASQPTAEFDIQSFSGDIKNCFGPKSIQSDYGPGSRLEFKSGEGRAHVRVNTKSGDVRLCVKGVSMTKHSSSLSLARAGGPTMRLPYVY
jgi:Putative adhesin